MKVGYKILSLILVIVISLSFVSCSFDELIKTVFPVKGIEEDTSLGYTQVIPPICTYSKFYMPSSDKISYNQLPLQGEKALYDRLYENVYYIYNAAEEVGENETVYYKTKQVVLEDFVLSEAQVRTVIKALTDDFPSIFWTTSTFGILRDAQRNYTAVQLYSFLSADEIKEKLEKLVSVQDKFYEDIPDSLTEYQREKYVHDYIIDNCEYDSGLALDGTASAYNDDAFNVYGTLVNKKAVCEGYSRSFQLLLSGLGVKVVNIIGFSLDELHMWNAVSLAEDYYYVDVTWDDTDEEAYRYEYFNVTEDALSEDHTPSKLFSEMSDEDINGDEEEASANTMNLFIPVCNETAYNYYVRTCAHLEDYSGEAVTTALMVAAGDKKDYFQFYIDPDYLDFNEAVENLFKADNIYFGDYVDTVNGLLNGYEIDKNNITYNEMEKLCLVTTFLEYV